MTVAKHANSSTGLLRGILLCSLALFCAPVSAVGIGDVTLSSELGQPLRMSIALDNIGSLSEDEIQVKLADEAKYREFGVDRPAFHTRMKLDLQRNSSNGAMLSLSTRRPVNEPYVAFVLEVRWPSGRVFREFTVLLDPVN